MKKHLRLSTQTFACMAVATMVATAAAAEPIVLKLANEEPWTKAYAGIPGQVALMAAEMLVPSFTGGAVTVKLYPAAALGNEKQLIKSVGTGVVDITIVSPGNAASIIPEIQLLSASYLFNDFDHVRRVVTDNRFFSRWQEIVRAKNAGFQLAGFGMSGTRTLYNSKRVVKTPDDLEGLKMRVMSSPTEFKVWSALGTLPSNIPAPEIYTAIQTGVVDAGESSPPSLARGKYYEVAPFISLTLHQYNFHIFLIGDHALAKIPEQYRDAVMAALRTANITEIYGAEWIQKLRIDSLRAQPGVTVTNVDPRPFAAKVTHVQDEVAKEFKVEDILKVIRELGA